MTTVSSSRLYRVLIVGEGSFGGSAGGAPPAGAQIERAESLESVLQTLRMCDFDAVVASAEEVSGLRSLSPDRPELGALAAMPQGICIVNEVGEVEWSNPRLGELPVSVSDQVRRHCLEAIGRAGDEAVEECFPSRRRIRISTESGGRYEMTATPIIDVRGRVRHMAAVVWDVAGTERWREKIEAIDRAGRDLLTLDVEQFSRLEPIERLSLLEQKILRSTRDLLPFDHFEVRVLDAQTNRLDYVLGSSEPCGESGAELFARTEGSGIRGCVAARKRSHICSDLSRDPRNRPAMKEARSSLTIPLFLQEQLVGVADFESATPAAFSEDDRQLAESYGRYVALALHLMKLLASERQAAAGRIGRSVMAEVTGPINDLVTDIESFVEERLGDDELRDRLRAISESAARMRERIRDVVQPRPGIISERCGAPRRSDPILDSRRVLLADDEDVIRETIRDVLTGYGCVVETATDGATAIELLQSHPFDLVLSDIKMPVKSGYEVFAAAKAANPLTPVILTTGFGYDPNHSIVRARREGLSAVLFKPFKVDQLLHEIRVALKPAAV